MSEHAEHSGPEITEPTVQHEEMTVDQAVAEEFGQSGIEYVVLLRRPGSGWELHDGQVYPDHAAAVEALDAARAHLEQAPAALWAQLLRTPDSEFLPLATEYERLKGAEAALFARAVSAFVRAD